MVLMNEPFDHVVLGAGLTGLRHALTWRRAHPDGRLLVVERAPRPGGDVQTQRSNGFVCELGPFAFVDAEIRPLLGALARPPAIVTSTSDRGFVHDGSALRDCPVEPTPVSFASGCEEIVQAARRELTDALLLGREAAAFTATDAGFEVELGGEAPATLTTGYLTVAVPGRDALRLLAPFDHTLPALHEQLVTEPRAFVFLGGLASDCEALTGYGIVPTVAARPDGAEPDGSRPANARPNRATVEVIHCSNAFPRRCLPDRFLARSELAGTAVRELDDDGLAARATADLQALTGHAVPFGFTKVHRFDIVAPDAADATRAELRTRLRSIADQVPGLTIA